MPGDLEVGYIVFVQAVGKFFRVAARRDFADSTSVVLTASQTISNTELTGLKSPQDQIFHIRAIGLEDDVNFTFRWRGKGQIGVKSTANLTIDLAPLHAPFPLDIWMYVYSPFYDITENKGLAKTAVVRYWGEVYDLEEMTAANEKEMRGKPYMIVDG